MTLHRFFAPVEGHQVLLSREQTRQIRTVLRLREGDRIAVFDGSGGEWLAILNGGLVEIEGPLEGAAEPSTVLTLYQALVRAPRMEMVLQKCTELGVSRYVPFIAARSVATGDHHQRWQTITTEAAEQSGRRVVPEVAALLTFKEAIAAATGNGCTIMPWEEMPEPKLGSLKLPAKQVNLIIGPEGGFTQEEAGLARASGALLVSLGSRILRSETAAMAATTIIMQLGGDM